MATKRVKDGPHWVKAWISDLSALTDKFRDLETGAVNFTELGKEEYKFRMALSRKDFTLSERARKVWDEAVGPYQQRVSAARKNTTEGAANGNNADVSATDPTVDAPATQDDLKSLVSASLSMAGTSNNEAAVTTKTQRQRRAGGSVRESVDPFPPARQHVSGDVLNLAYSGEFGNVLLTQEQYNELGIKFGNQQKLNRAIDSLSCQIENGEKTPKNHYAELVKWANYRDDMEEKEELKAATQPHFETVSEHNARIVRESDKWIDEYYSQKRKAANNGK